MEEEVALATRRRGPGLALAGTGLVCGLAYTAEALRYPVGSVQAPGPGLFPVAVGALLVGTSAVAALAAWHRPSAPPEALGPFAWRIPALLGVLAGCGWLLGTAGFVVAATLLAAVVLALERQRPAWAVLLAAVAISGATAFAFRLLGVPLPGVPL
ncbi:MAG: tripartite tricarboxylate transporter TctB family protein [Betaproteobacteria bacterium]